jgi:hypothetical protein
MHSTYAVGSSLHQQGACRGLVENVRFVYSGEAFVAVFQGYRWVSRAHGCEMRGVQASHAGRSDGRTSRASLLAWRLWSAKA